MTTYIDIHPLLLVFWFQSCYLVKDDPKRLCFLPLHHSHGPPHLAFFFKCTVNVFSVV